MLQLRAPEGGFPVVGCHSCWSPRCHSPEVTDVTSPFATRTGSGVTGQGGRARIRFLPPALWPAPAGGWVLRCPCLPDLGLSQSCFWGPQQARQGWAGFSPTVSAALGTCRERVGLAPGPGSSANALQEPKQLCACACVHVCACMCMCVRAYVHVCVSRSPLAPPTTQPGPSSPLHVPYPHPPCCRFICLFV